MNKSKNIKFVLSGSMVFEIALPIGKVNAIY